jgi:DNA repair photolyase
MSLVRSTRDGKDYVSAWRERQTGTGPYAELIAQRFKIAAKRLGLNAERAVLRHDLFTPPAVGTTQLDLFKS